MGLYTKIIDMQKLNRAWQHVKKNHSAPGTDGVTWEEFDKNSREQIKQLNIELKEGKYKPLPVKIIQLEKNGKKRTVTMYCMRDKVVQQSIVEELNKMYDHQLSSSVYAYRQGYSAMKAVEKIDADIVRDKYDSFVYGDIKSFFDEIPQEKIVNILKERIKDEDVIELIEKEMSVSAITESGLLERKLKGLYQGSILAPILSNIYLKDFDEKMQQNSDSYIRYSDDFLCLCKDISDAKKLIDFSTKFLLNKKLELNKEKTKIGNIEEGFDFLGYHFSEGGKEIPVKAEKHLDESLDSIWLELTDLSIDQKIDKCLEISRGWEQYYKEERKPSSIIELVIRVKNGSESQADLSGHRELFHNIYHDVLIFLSDYWKKNKNYEMQLFEYEDYFELLDDNNNEIKDEYVRRCILDIYEELVVDENVDSYTELMQMYSDVGKYQVAAMIADKIKIMKKSKNKTTRTIGLQQENALGNYIKDVNRYMNLFIGRDDVYKDEIEVNGHRTYEDVAQPLTHAEIRSHLAGARTVATYIQRNNSTVHYMIFDIDISKRILLQCDVESKAFEDVLNKCFEVTLEIKNLLRKYGIECYIEDSGYRGYHIWIFFEDWLPVRYCNLLSDGVIAGIKSDEDINIEVFPNKTRVKNGKLGQAIKLPYGVHSKTGRCSVFIEDDGGEIADVTVFLQDIVLYSLVDVKRAINKSSRYKIVDTNKMSLNINPDEIENIQDEVAIVLEHCNLMKYLFLKAKTTGYLTHGERLTLLYVFGHMGNSGKEFLHHIMEFTVNYKYHVTQKFIEKLPANPISCTKLREQYKLITAEYGCNCNFRRSKNCYPSPVLHGIKLGKDNTPKITIPTARPLSEKKQKQIREEINASANVQNLAKKILELKKQRRGLNKSIAKIDKELSMVFDQEKVDCMEIEMGLLCRRKKDGETEWFIEL